MKRIYLNGTIITMEEGNPQAEAICIQDGIITMVGSKVKVMAEKDAEIIDLQGKTMLPGFIDGHSHLSGVAFSFLQVDLSTARSFADIVILLKEHAKNQGVKPGEWMIGRAYDHNFLVEKNHPDRHILDEVSTDNPILISHASSHMGVVNTKALEILGIDGNTPDPQGGRIAKNQVDKIPTGYLEEDAFIASQTKLPIPTMSDMMLMIAKALKTYASYGITTVQDGMMVPQVFSILYHASRAGVLDLDVIAYADLNNSHFLALDYKELVNQYKNHFKIGGYKIFLDGSPQGRTAWMLEPYMDGEDGYRGYPVLTDERLNELIQESLSEHMQLLAHCNGDAAAQQFITQFEQVVMETGLDPCRSVMVHAQLVRPEQLRRMAKLEMIASFFVAHSYHWGDIHVKNFGYDRAAIISPTKSAKKAGVVFNLHQDSPVIQPDMMETVWCAVNRKTKDGVLLSQEECLTVYEALQAITIHSAYSYFEEDRKGSIKEGKLADLVILDQNPLAVNKMDIREIKVLETLKEGRTVYKA